MSSVLEPFPVSSEGSLGASLVVKATPGDVGADSVMVKYYKL